MAIDTKTVEYTARLARIELTEQELDKLSGQLDEIISFIDRLKTLDIGNIAPMSHILPVENVLREDEPRPSLPPDEALKNAPRKENNFFAVPKVIT